MNKQAVIEREIKSIQTKQDAVPLKTVMKEVLIYLYCKGVIREQTTQRIYNFFKLKEM